MILRFSNSFSKIIATPSAIVFVIGFPYSGVKKVSNLHYS